MQASAILSTACKYALSVVDAALEGRWEGKGTYVFYLELTTDMLHLFVYLVFFVIVFANYGLPLHLVWHQGRAGAKIPGSCMTTLYEVGH